MYETLRGNECREHLEKLIENGTEGTIVIWGHKTKIVIEGADMFHKIAQKMKVNEINRVHGGLHYLGKIEKELWTICLEDGLNETFLNKYGKEYQIN